jgi:putative oxidoreductase
MKRLFAWLLNSPDSAPKATVLIRLMAGGVFLWEGILKFVYTNQGVGRFTKIGIPAPHASAAFVGGLEILGGVLLITGLFTRLIAIPFTIEMLVAIASTKIAIYLGTSPLPLPPSPPQVGIWAVLHEVRSEYAQLFSVLFLGIVGPGKWSLDAIRAREKTQPEIDQIPRQSTLRELAPKLCPSGHPRRVDPQAVTIPIVLSDAGRRSRSC